MPRRDERMLVGVRTIALVVMVMVNVANAGHGHGGGGHSSSSAHSVRGYSTKRGTYVAPHRQTNADHTQRNNWSTKGNVNPDTGRVGTKRATR